MTNSPRDLSPLPVGFTVWFTGLPGAGKTTIAIAVAEQLRSRGYERVEVLDGDELRRSLSRDLGFSRADRDENVQRVAFVCEVLERNGIIALVALVSPYEQAREEARARLRMTLVHVDAPLDVLMQRDPKGLYRRARSGAIVGVTGVDDPYETPARPDLYLRTDLEQPHESATRVLRRLEDAGLIPQQ